MLQTLKSIAWITLISGLVFIPFLGRIPLFDWDEVNFAEAAREMILTGSYSRVYIDFVPFWEKPPLFFWLQAISMKIFGINAFAARFPNAICGVITLNILYLIGRQLYDHRFGLLWVLAYGGSILPHLYFRSGIIDPWFNLFIFLSLYFLITSGQVRSQLNQDSSTSISETTGKRRSNYPFRLDIQPHVSLVCLGGLFTGLAILTKGPVAYLVVVLVVGIYWLIRKFRANVSFWNFTLYSLIGLLMFSLWYGIETTRNGTSFIIEFTKYQVELLLTPGAGHAGFPGYHIVVLLVGCFPASILALQPVFRKTTGNERQLDFKLWMILLLIIVVLLFSIVRSKIVHYSSLCYFPLTYLATLYIWNKMRSKASVGLRQKFGIALIGLLYIVAGIAIVYFGNHPGLISAILPLDENATASLSLDVDWHWWHILPVVFMLIAILMAWKMNSDDVMKHAVLMYICVAAFAYSGIICWVGKVQQYTQGPATQFYKSLAGKDVYAVPWGHKSYSQYWDFQKPVPIGFSRSIEDFDALQYARFSDPEYLLTSTDVTKDVYVITKAAKAEDFHERYPDVTRIGGKGGFVFFLKDYEDED